MNEQQKRKVLVGGLAALIVGAGSICYVTRDGDPEPKRVTQDTVHGRQPRPPSGNRGNVRPPRPIVKPRESGPRIRPPRPPHRPGVIRDRPRRGGYTVRPKPHHKPIKPAA